MQIYRLATLTLLTYVYLECVSIHANLYVHISKEMEGERYTDIFEFENESENKSFGFVGKKSQPPPGPTPSMPGHVRLQLWIEVGFPRMASIVG
jgi:hypothetical protein